MQGKILTAVAVATLALVSSAQAGFVAATGSDAFAYTGPGSALTPAVGSTISVTNNPLASYTPDGPSDPQIAAGDISSYLFSLSVNVISTPSPGVARATGTYSIFYDLGNDGTPDIRVSSGTAALDLSNLGVAGTYLVTGSLAQTLGPANPVFADLAYGNNANLVLQGGLYVGAGGGGTLNLVLSQKALVPEPATIGTLAGMSLLGLRRRRA